MQETFDLSAFLGRCTNVCLRVKELFASNS